MEDLGSICRSEAEVSFDDRSTSSILLVGGSATLRVGSGSSHDWEADRQRHLYHDSDTRSQCSQKSDLGYNSAGGSGMDNPSSSMRSVGSVGSHGSGDYRGNAGLPMHVGHAHFGHAVTVSAAHLLNGDATHQFPPSMYHASVDAPKSDAATVCSSSVLEDIEVESHVSGEGGQTNVNDTLSSAASLKSHPSPPSSVKMAPTGLRRSNSAEGNRLVDFADRSQVALASVIPQHQYRHSFGSDGAAAHRTASTADTMSTATSGTGIMEDDMDMTSLHNTTGRAAAGMGPPLSRTWLLQQQTGGSPSRPGSVKSFESNTGSDVVAHVGSDCGGSLTDAQSILSQEDALMAAASESGELSAMAKVSIASEDGDPSAKHDGNEEDSKPHPLLCSQPENGNGRTSPGGTIYRGRGVRRYNGRFMHLPLKRFHQNGVHLSSVGESGHNTGHPVADYDDRWQDRGYSALEDDYQRDSHNYYGSTRREPSVRSRSRSRSPSPPSAAARADNERKNGYHHTNGAGRNGFHSSKAGRGYDIHPLNGRNGFKDNRTLSSSEKPSARPNSLDKDHDDL